MQFIICDVPLLIFEHLLDTENRTVWIWLQKGIGDVSFLTVDSTLLVSEEDG